MFSCNSKEDKSSVINVKKENKNEIKRIKLGMNLADIKSSLDKCFHLGTGGAVVVKVGEKYMYFEHNKIAFALEIITQNDKIVSMRYSSIENFNKPKFSNVLIDEVASIDFNENNVIGIEIIDPPSQTNSE